MKKDLTAEQRRAIRESLAEVRAELGGIRAIFESRLAKLASFEAAEERRRARLRRLSFGLLGRA